MSTQLRLLASVAAHLVKSMHGIMAVYATCIASLFYCIVSLRCSITLHHIIAF